MRSASALIRHFLRYPASAPRPPAGGASTLGKTRDPMSKWMTLALIVGGMLVGIVIGGIGVGVLLGIFGAVIGAVIERWPRHRST